MLVLVAAGVGRAWAWRDRAPGAWPRRVVPACESAGEPAGARPPATDSGSEVRPIRWPAIWLADHAIVAVATIPSSAAVDQMIVRCIIAPAT